MSSLEALALSCAVVPLACVLLEIALSDARMFAEMCNDAEAFARAVALPIEPALTLDAASIGAAVVMAAAGVAAPGASALSDDIVIGAKGVQSRIAAGTNTYR